jgi:hypothetical protein
MPLAYRSAGRPVVVGFRAFDHTDHTLGLRRQGGPADADPP